MNVAPLIVCSALLMAGCLSTTRDTKVQVDVDPVPLRPTTLHPASDRPVLVGVYDDATKSPVVGVKITASYLDRGPPPAVTVGDEALTNERGLALVRGWYENGTKPFFTAKIDNEGYYFDGASFGTFTDDRQIAARSPEDRPTEVDLSFSIPSRVTEEIRRLEWEKREAAASQEAERLFTTQPDYWPPRGKDSYPWPEGDSASELIGRRWRNASKNVLGTGSDTASIEVVVKLHLKHPKARVGEIRWLDQMTVMVAVSWYEGPEAAAGYTYVLRRNQKGEWHVQTYYMNYIS